ncbi:MAG: protease [Rhodothermales bacterium]|nr:protease [Rhodothermales bacterium]
MKRPFLLLIAILTAIPAMAQRTGYYRFPALHGTTLVFSAEGDLWRTDLSGGDAVRLTTHPGQERYPVMSPDGSQVAFYGAYEGEDELYVMPVAGGAPTRLTWDGGGSRPVSWSEDAGVVYMTPRYSTLPDFRLATINPETWDRSRVPLNQAADGVYAEDGTLWFVRMPRQASNSRWYKGGTAQTLWKWHPDDAEAELVVTDWPGTTKLPRPHGDRVYFLSDRGGKGMNVWSMHMDGSDFQRHTDHMDWDIQEHTLHGDNLVYRLGGDLYHLDLSTGQEARIPISLVSDFDQRRETWEQEPMQHLSSWSVSPDGKRVALAARGEVFVAPAGEEGRLVHVSRDSGVRFRSARFAPDGTHLLGISDASGELEWWRLPVDGIGVPSQISSGMAHLKQDGVPSPDGKWLVHPDYDRNLWLLNLEKGTSRRIGEPSPIWTGQGPSPAWSSDSRYVAFENALVNRMATLYVHDVAENRTTEVTTHRYEDYAPAFGKKGDWLYFLSDRTLTSSVGSPWGARAPAPHFENQTRIYAIPIKEGARWAFRVPTETDVKPDSTERPTTFSLTESVHEAPVPRGNYAALSSNDKRLFYLSQDSGWNLVAVDLEPEAKPVVLVEGVSGYDLSADGSSILVRRGSTLAVIPASSGAKADLDKGKVDLSSWKIPVDPPAEWQQMFVDAWRLHRDYFWDPNMHGVNWEAVRAQYEPLVERVTSREELTDIQAQMISHLSLMHSNARSGEVREGNDDIQPASLGGMYERVESGFRVTHVYRTDPDLPGERAPLARLDVGVGPGAVITMVDGESTAGAPDLGVFLRGKAGQPVRLRVMEGDSTRDVIVEAVSIGEERDLRYDDWEYTRRLQTEEDGDGQIGYVHLRAMGSSNIAEWTRDFYPVFNRAGLILDFRHNNGGNIDSWILQDLVRRPWMYFQGRSGGPFWNMHYAFHGHMVMLVDERSASDGEAVADGFRRLGLGTVIGTRTWGGEIWLSGSNRQVDSGVVRASEAGVYGAEGEWLLEGWGLEPDIVVDNLPRATFDGRDAQLEAAIAHLQELIRTDPRGMPPPPPYPIVVPGEGFPTPWRSRY